MNNNPIKKKAEFEKELKKTKKLKDISMKKKKKLWIKIDLMEKDKKNDESINEKKIYLSKQNQKSKIINLNIINEEESNKKSDQNLVLGTESKEGNDEDETDLGSDFIIKNQIHKKSQDDFDIDLTNKNNIENDSDLFIGKYKQYLKNKNNKKNKEIKKIK